MFKGRRGPVEEFASRWGPSADLWFVGVDSGRGMDPEHVASLEVCESTIDGAYESSRYLSPVACLRNKALVFIRQRRKRTVKRTKRFLGLPFPSH